MTQHSFDFALQPRENDQEIQKLMEKHNQQVLIAARTSTISSGSLMSALDRSEAKSNAVYLLRGALGQILRKSMGSGMHPSKRGFLKAIRAEMTMKKSPQDPAFTLRDILMKMTIS